MRSHWGWVGPQRTRLGVLLQRGNLDSDMQGGDRDTMDCWRTPEARKRQRRILRELSGWHDPADTWCWTSSLRKLETIHFCCFKLLRVRYFVTTALENRTSQSEKPGRGDTSCIYKLCTTWSQTRLPPCFVGVPLSTRKAHFSLNPPHRILLNFSRHNGDVSLPREPSPPHCHHCPCAF